MARARHVGIVTLVQRGLLTCDAKVDCVELFPALLCGEELSDLLCRVGLAGDPLQPRLLSFSQDPLSVGTDRLVRR
jgi:hypothetical protein